MNVTFLLIALASIVTRTAAELSWLACDSLWIAGQGRVAAAPGAYRHGGALVRTAGDTPLQACGG